MTGPNYSHTYSDYYKWGNVGTPGYANHLWWYDGVYGESNQSHPNITSPLFGDIYGRIWEVPGKDLSVQGWTGTPGGFNWIPPTWVTHYYARGVNPKWKWQDGDGGYHTVEVGVGAATEATLFTGGKCSINRKHLFTVQAGATEYGESKKEDGGGWAHTPTKAVPNTEIRVLGEYCNNLGEVKKSLDDNQAVSLFVWCRGVKHYNARAEVKGADCSPKRIDFADTPSTPSNFWPRHFRATLVAVCHQNWATNSIVPLITMTWGFNISTNGIVEIIKPTNNGTLGQCQKIIVDYNDANYFVLGPNIPVVVMKAHYIGCCEGDLNWIQHIDVDDQPLPHIHPPCLDGNPQVKSYYPFWYGPNGSVGQNGSPDPDDWMENNTSDYIQYNDWPNLCL